MQNMYMTPIAYTNFNGAKKQTKLHFHITPREFADWMIDNKQAADRLLADFTEMQSSMEADPDGEATEAQKLSMLRLVKILAELSYGHPSEDGELFTHDETFKYSAKYDAFRMFLFTNIKELETFIQTILNEEVIAEWGKQMENVERPEQQTAEVRQLPGQKGNKSREEVLAMMREHGITPAE